MKNPQKTHFRKMAESLLHGPAGLFRGVASGAPKERTALGGQVPFLGVHGQFLATRHGDVRLWSLKMAADHDLMVLWNHGILPVNLWLIYG